MTFWHRYRAAAVDNAGAPAVIDQRGRSLTHGELLGQAEQAAAGLAARGLGPGDVIGVFLPNRASWPVMALAAACSGIGALGLNTRFRHAELNHLLAVADVDVVMVAGSFLGLDGVKLMNELDRPLTVIVDDSVVEGHLGGSDGNGVGGGEVTLWSDLLTAEPAADRSGADRPLIGFTTSGTTGFPKVAMHSQAQTLAHLDAVAAHYRLSAETVHLDPLPFCGAFGYTSAMATLLAGGTVVTHETWHPDTAARAIEEHRVTYCNGSDDMLLALFASEDFNAERTTWTDGGFADFTNAAAEVVAVADGVARGRLRLTGLYGSSEGFALMSAWARNAELEQRAKGGGHLVGAEMAVRCCDPDSGIVLENGDRGELQFRGPNLIDGYLNNPEATARAFTDDGWYRSGDLGYTVAEDDRGHQGFVFLARLGDSLRLRGFLCDPAEIENHLETHEAVELAQVVGVTQPGTGDVAVAFVRLDPHCGGEADEAALLQHCRSGLANYKRPARIVVVDEFPVTDGPNGVKIRKVDLRTRAAALVEERPGDADQQG